ncbi:diguanylate cyclase [Hansschlegelia quercus]|uniref:diguanylate cyclase n=1 Tax=Hansschlegelia quercus TaxID=2528245 RepID=A0A4Q9GJ59_9HYPH|nr:diguanylate cyclase [Hansschlegelia quercus]TBN54329.1 diguanylate cyclase [Hansschlegelia quercus]
MLLVVGAVAPLVALLAADVYDARYAAIENALTTVELRAGFAAERQSRVFDRAAGLLSDFRATGGVDTAGGAQCQKAAASFANRNSEFMTVGVVDADGVIVCHSSIADRRSFTDPDLVSAVLKTSQSGVVVSRLTVGKVTGKRTLIIAMQTESGSTSPPGIVFASIDLASFSNLAELSVEDDIGTVLVVDGASGEVFAGGGVGRSLIGGNVGEPLRLAMQRHLPRAGAWLPLFGEEQVVGFAPLRAQGGSRPMMVVAAPTEQILADANQQAIRHVIVAVGVTVFALGATWLIGVAALAQPIRRLTGTAESIGAGRLDARVLIEPWQARELRTLAGALNDMAIKLGAAQEHLESLANQDSLTGLANRRRFDSALAVECRRAQRDGLPLSLLLIDIDFFKSFNDEAGHLAGDRCLRRVGAALKECATRAGDLAARYGGEEFALILSNTSEQSAISVAANVHDAIRRAGVRRPGPEGGFLTVSIGIASSAKGAGEIFPEQMVAVADDALYAAKLDGRNRSRIGVWPTTPVITFVDSDVAAPS